MIALLSVFSQIELVEELLCDADKKARRTRTLDPAVVNERRLKKTALLGLAEQMGGELSNARGKALRRSVEIAPSADLLGQRRYLEPHRRGEVFSAAVLSAFVGAWSDRIVGVGKGDGLGKLADGRYSLRRVAEEGASIADYFMTMLIRGLDYMPPVHVTFGDVLSATLTADVEIRPDDSRYLLRDRLLKRFAAYGICPASDREDVPGIWRAAPDKDLSYDRVHFESMRSDPDEVFRFLWENRETLGLREEPYTRVISVRPCVRVDRDGFTLRETVAEYYQVANLTLEELQDHNIEVPAALQDLLKGEPAKTGETNTNGAADVDGDDDRQVGQAEAESVAAADDDIDARTLTLYGGGTLIFDEYGRLKYHLSNDVLHASRQSTRLADLVQLGDFRVSQQGSLVARGLGFSTLHRLRSLDGSQIAGERW